MSDAIHSFEMGLFSERSVRQNLSIFVNVEHIARYDVVKITRAVRIHRSRTNTKKKKRIGRKKKREKTWIDTQ